MKDVVKKRWLRGVVVVLLLVLAVFCTVRALYSPRRMGPHPLCNISLDFMSWTMVEHPKEDNPPYPNVKGSGRESLREITKYMAPKYADRLLRDYAYVPGLRPADPTDLVLLYLNRPTRYTWHGDTKALSRDPAWLTFSPCFDSPLDAPEWCPEDGRRLPPNEFRARLQRTLDFLKEEDRPHWQEVLQEHTAILESTDE